MTKALATNYGTMQRDDGMGNRATVRSRFCRFGLLSVSVSPPPHRRSTEASSAAASSLLWPYLAMSAPFFPASRVHTTVFDAYDDVSDALARGGTRGAWACADGTTDDARESQARRRGGRGDDFQRGFW